MYSEDQGVLTTLLLFGDLFEVLIDNSHCEHDTRAATNSAHNVSEDAKSADANTTETGSSCDVTGEVANHRVFSKTTLNSHILLHKLSANITR